jgi:phosphocarrier protein FPr
MKLIKRLFNRKIDRTLTITSINGFHLRPIAKFVNEVKKYDTNVTIIAHNKEVVATQVPKILSLALENGESFTLRCVKGDAKKSSEKLSSFFVKLMNEDKVIEEIKQEEESYEGVTLRGQTISKGIAISNIALYEKIEVDGSNEVLSIEEAIAKTQKELSLLYEENITKEEAHIYLAQKELLNSEVFEKNFHNIDMEIEKLKGTIFESRMADYQDLKQRILAYMGREIRLNLPKTPYILLAEELLPSDISKLVKSPIEGVILQKGTPTSHASILLRSETIPSVIINDTICKSNPCNYPNAIIDASSGSLILKPTENDLTKAKEKQKKFKEQEAQSYKKRFESTKTKKGREIQVLANIADLESAKEAKEHGADGVGLFRTEFLFTQTKPSLKQQKDSYTEIFNLFDNITIRTLDIGGDKSLPYINIEKEDNPFLGIRGIRFSLQEETLFKEQLLAIFMAHNNRAIKIMFPMISSTEEFKKAKEIAKAVATENRIDINNIKFGIMLEVPSVIFALKEFDKLVDFYSIGTNDLTQYLFAIERTHPTLVADATSPMLMTALKQIRGSTQKPISICGELAGLEDATTKLIEMGYNTLSVSSKLIPSLKERIRHV